ncbi:MAG: hypothetical protein GY821_12805 [Gammaproteobacteria bacterium]|nr:hypothetical protein [Gammaproteobacteria bacterium]
MKTNLFGYFIRRIIHFLFLRNKKLTVPVSTWYGIYFYAYHAKSTRKTLTKFKSAILKKDFVVADKLKEKLSFLEDTKQKNVVVPATSAAIVEYKYLCELLIEDIKKLTKIKKFTVR